MAASALAMQCYPNPFNPAVKIAYTMPARVPLSLKLYDVRGRLVRVLHYDGTPITARFIATAIRKIVTRPKKVTA